MNEHYTESHEPNCKGVESEEDFYDIPDLALFEPSFNNKGEESEADEDDDEESSEREEEGFDPKEEDGDKVNSEGDENDDEDHPKHGHKEDNGHSQRKCTECDFTAPTKLTFINHQKTKHESKELKIVKKIGCQKCDAETKNHCCTNRNFRKSKRRKFEESRLWDRGRDVGCN